MSATQTKDKIRELRREAILERKASVYLRAVNWAEAKEMALKLERSSSEKIELAETLKALSRLDKLSVYRVEMKKSIRKGEYKAYSYWYASWRVGKKVRTVYLGSVNEMGRNEALAKARELKAKSLKINL
jgi:hypothetical protein